tara:strand:- start:1154 stop:1378 length:225 start_codon:yes stop_codon:yes gene_type:complete
MIIVSEPTVPPDCHLCKKPGALHVSEYNEAGVNTEAWWRCLSCGKEYGFKMERNQWTGRMSFVRSFSPENEKES